MYYIRKLCYLLLKKLLSEDWELPGGLTAAAAEGFLTEGREGEEFVVSFLLLLSSSLVASVDTSSQCFSVTIVT